MPTKPSKPIDVAAQIQPFDISMRPFQQVNGFELVKAPQPKLTAPDNNTPNSGSPGTDDIISNMRTRILELETALVNLGIIKSR